VASSRFSLQLPCLVISQRSLEGDTAAGSFSIKFVKLMLALLLGLCACITVVQQKVPRYFFSVVYDTRNKLTSYTVLGGEKRSTIRSC